MLAAMAQQESQGLGLSQVYLACGRLASSARGIAQAHDLGVAEGPHESLWSEEYHAEVVDIYGESLPVSYQRAIASLFTQSADEMAEQYLPAALTEDWQIVTDYMRHAAAAIMSWLASQPGSPQAPGALPKLDDVTPMVIRFDLLAEIASHKGARRLEGAALAVQDYVGPPSVLLNAEQHRLLERVASGTPIDEMAREFGYSRRSMFRHLHNLWETLGVGDRTQGLRKAVTEGLLK